MNDLDFIKDKNLNKTIEDSIEYIYVIFEQTKKGSQNDLYQEETFRVIILYVVSIIEAVLLYLYKVRGDHMVYFDYKFVNQLPREYQHKEEGGSQIVVAVQKKLEKSDHQIGLFDLVSFYKSKKIIRDDTAKSILDLNNVRNTFHFGKPRHEIKCDSGQVESALNLLVYILEKAPEALMTKK